MMRCLIGSIIIREEKTGRKNISGDLYLKGDTFFVLEGFTKDSGGKAIFHMFSK